MRLLLLYRFELTSAVDETISRIANITNAVVASNSVVTVGIRLTHRYVEITFINV